MELVPMSRLAREWRRAVVGTDREVPLLSGGWRQYANLDNAATTPALVRVREQVNVFLEWYSSVHRGTGFKSRLSTQVYEEARKAVLRFVDADADEHIAIFTKHTTEAINKLAFRFPLGPGDVVILSELEHHAVLLPWRNRARIEYLPLDQRGAIDFTALPDKLRQHAGKVRLVAISGASNVTGYTPPLDDVATMVHAFGAELLVDAAQLAPHRQIHMRPLSDPRHIDYLVFSGHKIYAPYGTGVLIGPRARFTAGEPDIRGGGAVKFVTLDAVEWDDPPEREEAGSPNVVGAVALATALTTLTDMDMALLEKREQHLSAYLLDRLATVPRLRLLGDLAGMGQDRVGLASFVLDGIHPQFVAAVLGHEWGIGVRAGCFCAHPYLLKLLQVSDAAAEDVRAAILRGDRSQVPGAIRASLGLYSLEEDVDRLVDALRAVADGRVDGQYVLDAATEEYEPVGYADHLASAFHL